MNTTEILFLQAVGLQETGCKVINVLNILQKKWASRYQVDNNVKNTKRSG